MNLKKISTLIFFLFLKVTNLSSGVVFSSNLSLKRDQESSYFCRKKIREEELFFFRVLWQRKWDLFSLNFEEAPSL